MIRQLPLILLLLFGTVPAYGQIGDILKGLGLDKKDSLSDDTVASGLKEALKIGTQNTVDSTGRIDGYLANEAIKILLPEKLQTFEKGLRMVGYGPKVDEFVVSMNRAAEKAAPLARDIFWTGIKEMTIDDARKILAGSDTAATDCFREKTGDRLSEAFAPVVSEAMEEVGVTRQYRELTDRFSSIPFMKSEAFDLDQYVVEKALDGLFHVLGQEEKKIRHDPVARVTDILKTVFG